ncbi:MAG TPA: thiamine phosphate synthase [Bacteroidia bacterium]
MKLILVSPSDKKDFELPFLLNMLEQGLPTYHLRKIKYSTRQLSNFIAEIPEKYHPRIVVHTHHKLAMKYDLKGIYLSRSHKKRKIKTWLRTNWFKLRKNDLQVSTSIRNIETLLEHQSKYNYVFLSPVFDSLTGNFQAAFSDQSIRTILKQSKYKVIARGGISVDNIKKSHELGFDGVVLYSSIWKTPNPVQEFQKIKAKFAELNLPME